MKVELPLPLPAPARQRLYTTPSTYARLAADVLRGRVHAPGAVERLERVLAEDLGVPASLAVHMGRLGIYLALRTMITPERRKVVLSPFTIFDVVNMVVCAGGEPVFADVCLPSATIDPDEVERLVDARTAAVLVTHTHSYVVGLDRIVTAAHTSGAAVIEDCAVAFGCRRGGRSVGTMGDVGVFSFGLFKNVSAIFGGAVVARDPERLATMAREQARFAPVSPEALVRRMWFGLQVDVATHPWVFRGATYWVFRAGRLRGIEWINRRTRNDPRPFARTELPQEMRVRMSATQAELVIAQHPRVRAEHRQRLALAGVYEAGFADVPEVERPRLASQGSSADGFLVYPIWVEDREALLDHLTREGLDCPSYYYRDTSQLACFEPFGRVCPRADRAASNVVVLPVYPGYGRAAAERVVASVRRFFGRT